jgi:hypothetical protein
VLFIGDFYRNLRYPFIDINNGGTLKGMMEGSDATANVGRRQHHHRAGPGTLIKRKDFVPTAT